MTDPKPVIYVGIGNSDDGLTQTEWHLFVSDTRGILRMFVSKVHGMWFSLPDDPWQNACFCVEFEDDERANTAKVELGRLAARFRQESIAWAEAPVTEFLSGVK